MTKSGTQAFGINNLTSPVSCLTMYQIRSASVAWKITFFVIQTLKLLWVFQGKHNSYITAEHGVKKGSHVLIHEPWFGELVRLVLRVSKVR